GAQFDAIPTSDVEILSLAEDREGNLWAGTAGGGVDRVRPRLVRLEGGDTGAPFQAVQSLSEGTNGDVWATTQDGSLVRFNDGAWTTIATNAEFASTM